MHQNLGHAQRRLHLIPHGEYAVPVGHIRLHRQCPTSHPGQLRHQLVRLQPVGVIMHRNVRSAVRKGMRHDTSQLPGGSGNQSGFSCQIQFQHIHSSLGQRVRTCPLPFL